MNKRIPCYFAILLALVMLSGCPPNNNARVNIVYDQLANFYEYRLSADAFSSTSAGNGMFIMYKIEEIENTGSEAMTFVFDKQNIVAIAPDMTSNVEPSGDNILLGASLATNITVGPGQTMNDVGCIIKNVQTNDPAALFNTGALVGITHQINSDQPVSMFRAAGDTSTALVGDALPSTLQNICAR